MILRENSLVMKNGKKEIETFDERHLAIVAKLRNIALQQMRKTGYSAQFYTLQKTEVADEIFEDKAVIEKFNNLFSQSPEIYDQSDVDEFIKFCTVKIKHYLIDYMRRKFAEKRGGSLQFVPFDDSLDIFSALDIKAEQIEHLNEALEKLENESSFHAGIIENKYFLGMKNKEIAEHLNVSLSKVEKDSHYAIAWLKRELSK
jgi:RNA polymerase sigma factor (sigma-70 family)